MPALSLKQHPAASHVSWSGRAMPLGLQDTASAAKKKHCGCVVAHATLISVGCRPRAMWTWLNTENSLFEKAASTEMRAGALSLLLSTPFTDSKMFLNA